MKFKPINDKILIKKQSPAKTTSSGLILASVKNNVVVEAEVLALGSGREVNNELIEFNVKVGDKVLVFDNVGTSIVVEEQEVWLIEEPTILGKILQ